MNRLEIHQKEGYTIVQTNCGKVNVIKQEMANEWSAVFSELEDDGAAKGAILAGLFFSARLDSTEFIGYNKVEMTQFLQ